MDELRGALGLPAEIVIGDRSVFLPADPFLGRLSGESTVDFSRARVHLEGARRALDEALARDAPGAGEVQGALDRAYRGVVQISPSLLDRISRVLSELIAWVMHVLGNFVGASSVLAWAVLLGLVAAGLLLLRRARLVPERILSGRGADRGPETKVDWRQRAQEALRAGDLREAIRALYLALITTLAGRGLLADAPALTAGEARAAVRRTRPTLYALVARATDSYERVLYGGVDPQESDIQALLEAEAGARSG
jgi:hypothetical protein